MKINTKYHCSNFFLCEKLKSRVSFIQLKPILDIFSPGFSLSSCPQHNLKVLLLLNATCILKHALNREENFSYFDPDYPISESVTGLARIYCTTQVFLWNS
jgi:hypothetical protein